jgi:hypothetical protein
VIFLCQNKKDKRTNNDLQYITQRTAVSSTNKIDRYNITEILLKVALSTINQTKPFSIMFIFKQKYQTYEYQHNGGWHQQKRVFRKISMEYRNLKTFLFPKVIFPGF